MERDVFFFFVEDILTVSEEDCGPYFDIDFVETISAGDRRRGFETGDDLFGDMEEEEPFLDQFLGSAVDWTIVLLIGERVWEIFAPGNLFAHNP